MVTRLDGAAFTEVVDGDTGLEEVGLEVRPSCL
jgi:hypothetical protein